jgi:hypothetical protein
MILALIETVISLPLDLQFLLPDLPIPRDGRTNVVQQLDENMKKKKTEKQTQI